MLCKGQWWWASGMKHFLIFSCYEIPATLSSHTTSLLVSTTVNGTSAFCVGSLEGASVELYSARMIKLTVCGVDLHNWVCDRSREIKTWETMGCSYPWYISLFENERQLHYAVLKKIISSVPLYKAKDPILPDFPGAVPVLWLSNSSVPVLLKIWFGAPNVPDFSKSLKILLFSQCALTSCLSHCGRKHVQHSHRTSD